MRKFKVGDKVRVIKHSRSYSSNNPNKIGTCFEIKHVMDFKSCGAVYFQTSEYKSNSGVLEDDLEFEHIYNSPLYKALK